MQTEDPRDLVHPGRGTELGIHKDICAKLTNGVRTLFQGECPRRGRTHTCKTHKRKRGDIGASEETRAAGQRQVCGLLQPVHSQWQTLVRARDRGLTLESMGDKEVPNWGRSDSTEDTVSPLLATSPAQA